MDGKERLSKILKLHKAKKTTRKQAQDRLVAGPGHLNKAAFNLAVEEGLCLVCSKYGGCLVRDPLMYTAYDVKREVDTGKCTWFEAMSRE